MLETREDKYFYNNILIHKVSVETVTITHENKYFCKNMLNTGEYKCFCRNTLNAHTRINISVETSLIHARIKLLYYERG